MALTLYAHPLSSYCWKVLIALYENDTPFAWRQLDFGDEAVASEFTALWPIGRMPVLLDDGQRIVESSMIIEHLGLRHPGRVRLIPADPEAALPIRALDRIFDNYVMTPLQTIVFNRIRPAESRDPYGAEMAHELLERAYGWLESELAGRDWAAGPDFSLADCAAAPSLHYADRVHPFRDRLPALGGYLARLEARPSFARVLKEAEPFSHMFPAEPA